MPTTKKTNKIKCSFADCDAFVEGQHAKRAGRRKTGRKMCALHEERTIFLKPCPRCGKDHAVLSMPLRRATGPFVRWGLCEETGEPVMMLRPKTMIEQAEQEILWVVEGAAFNELAATMDREVLGELSKLTGIPPTDSYIKALVYALLSEELPLNRVAAVVGKARGLVGTQWTCPGGRNIGAHVDELVARLLG